MRALLLYYSLTGETVRAVEIAAEACRREGWEVGTCRMDFADPAVRPQRPFKLKDSAYWSKAAKNGDVMEMTYEPANALEENHDLVLLFSNTWNHHPSVPMNSFLNSAAAAQALNGKPFAVFAVCRRLFEKNIGLVHELGERAGGRFLGGESLIHWGGGLGSMIQTVTYIHRSDTGMKRFLGFPLPAYGLSRESLEKIAPFTRRMLAASANVETPT